MQFFVCAYVFFTGFDLRFNLLSLSASQGERVGNSGDLNSFGSVSVPLKMFDVALIILVVIFALNWRSTAFTKNYTRVLWISALGAGYAILGLSSMLWEGDAYTSSQQGVAFLYTMKFLEMSLIPMILGVWFFGFNCNEIPLVRTLFFGMCIWAFLGIGMMITEFGGGYLMFDLPSYYGTLLMLSLFFFNIALTPELLERYNLGKFLVLFGALTGIAAVLVCGKRALVVGAVIGLSVLFIGHWRKVRHIAILLAVLPFVVWGGQSALDRTLGTENANESYLYEGITPRFSDYLLTSDSPIVEALVQVQGLDGSSRERIARTLYTFAAVEDHPAFGYGLFTAPFVGFLPDNMYSSSLLETGYVGLVVVIFMIIWSARLAMGPSSIGIRKFTLAIFLTMLACGLFFNVLSSSPFYGTYLLLMSILIYMFTANIGSQTPAQTSATAT